jgi:hypothetical protein
MIFSVKQLEVVLCSSDFKTRIVEQHDESLLPIIRLKVDFISLDCGFFISDRICVLKLNNLAKVNIIIAAALKLHFLFGFH